jgi:hypothetical protein
MGDALKKTVDELGVLVDGFKQEAQESLKPNKAAAKRARKLSLEIDKKLKIYRKQSV